MNKLAVFHKINSNYSYAEEKGVLCLTLRAAKNDLKLANVCYYNRFIGKIKKEKCALKYSDEMFDYYFARIYPENNSCVYYFELTDNLDYLQYFYEMGFVDNPPIRIGSFEMFALHSSEINTAPAWVQDSVFYQIFPDRFNRVNQTADNVEPWNSELTFTTRTGGNFEGIENKIDYLADLGINAIYLTPIFLSDSCHRYDTIDFYTIEPMLGTKADLLRLINRCHDAGIKVVLDAVFNHCSDKFFAFRDVLEKGEKSKYKDWFYINKFPLIEDNKINYSTFASERYMPRLNTENAEVAEYLIGAAEHWLNELNIDGYRLDVADEVSATFWRNFRFRIKKLKVDCFILGEVWHNGEYYLHNKFDSVMNYLFYDTVINYLPKGADEFKNRIVKQLVMYPEKNNFFSFNLIDSHDTRRALTAFNENKDLLKAAVVFQFCFCGVPCVYYGDEMGLSGENDPFNRKCMNFNGDINLYNFYKQLIKLRKDNDPLKKGAFAFLDCDGVAFIRTYKDEVIRVTINNTRKDMNIKISGETLMQSGFASGKLKQYGFIITKEKIN